MFARLRGIVNDAHRAGLAYRQLIDRSVGLTDDHRAEGNATGRPGY